MVHRAVFSFRNDGGRDLFVSFVFFLSFFFLFLGSESLFRRLGEVGFEETMEGLKFQ